MKKKSAFFPILILLMLQSCTVPYYIEYKGKIIDKKSNTPLENSKIYILNKDPYGENDTIFGKVDSLGLFSITALNFDNKMFVECNKYKTKKVKIKGIDNTIQLNRLK